MTAPLRASDPIVVNVALGERSYEIIPKTLISNILISLKGLQKECKNNGHGFSGQNYLNPFCIF